MGTTRRVAFAIMVAMSSLFASGCFAEIRPAQNVTETSATLMASGRTSCGGGSTTRFEIATSRAALGAGQGTTVTTYQFGQTAGACGEDPPSYPFSARATGLTPGTRYFYRVCGYDMDPATERCTSAETFVTVKAHPDLDTAVQAAFDREDVPIYRVTEPAPGIERAGVVINIHGGAWFLVGPDWMKDTTRLERWNERGYTTVDIDYRGGAASVPDVLAFYDAIRAWQGPDVEIGATGTSAGGHLALMIAVSRPDLEWVVSEAGPTDLTRLADGTDQSENLQGIANGYWKTDAARTANSPAHATGPVGARILLAGGVTDAMVTPRQMDFMKERFPQAEVIRMGAGSAPYVHTWVAAEGIAALHAAEVRIAAGD